MSTNYGDGVPMEGSGIYAYDTTWQVSCPACETEALVDVRVDRGVGAWSCPTCSVTIHEADDLR